MLIYFILVSTSFLYFLQDDLDVIISLVVFGSTSLMLIRPEASYLARFGEVEDVRGPVHVAAHGCGHIIGNFIVSSIPLYIQPFFAGGFDGSLEQKRRANLGHIEESFALITHVYHISILSKGQI